jgi:phosphoglycerol transferase
MTDTLEAVETAAPSQMAPFETDRAHHPWIRETAWVAGVSTAGLGVALLVYRVWSANLHLPLGYSYDMTETTSIVKGLGQNGWWLHNPQLGAPFGQDLRDFPSGGQTTQLVVLRAITAVVHPTGLAINIYFFAGFAVLAGVAFLALRRLGLSAPIAAGLAVAYDFLPFHLFHGPDHILHSAYFTAPLAVLLLVRVLEPDLRFVRDPRGAVRRPYFGPDGSLLAKPLVVLFLLAVVIGASEEMISIFTVVLLVIGGILATLAARRASHVVFALLLASAIAATLLLVSLPTILHVISVGKNPLAAKRYAFESDLYGLRPAFMLLPTPQHWVSALGSYARTLLRRNPFPSEGGQAIGTIGAIGVFIAIGMLFVRALRAQRGERDRHRRVPPSISMPLATVIVLAILLGAGGATFLDVLSGFVQLRTWNWIVLIIAFAAFVLTGLACERVWRSILARTSSTWIRRATVVIAVVVLAGVGILDGGRPTLPNSKSITAKWESDQAFVAAMHKVQPANGMIFEFPVVRFPESWPIANMRDYDQFRGYLADKGTFRWSYGSVKGRPQADWQTKLPAIPTAADLRALIGLGFTGLWVNRDGYTDRGQYFEARLVPLLGHPTLVSPDTQLAFYDLRPFTASIEPGTNLVAEAHARFGLTAPNNG